MAYISEQYSRTDGAIVNTDVLLDRLHDMLENQVVFYQLYNLILLSFLCLE